MRFFKKLVCVIFGWMFFIISSYAQWNKFIWVESTIDGVSSKKAALLFPVKIDHWSCYMQFDTGVDISILYRNNLPSYYKSALSSQSIVIKNFIFSGENSKNVEFSLLYDRDEPGPEDCNHDGTNVIGSLGNDEFLQGSLSLDLRNSQYSFQKKSYRPRSRHYESVPLELANTDRGVVPVLTVEDNKKQLQKMLFDTGSAPAGLIIYLKKNWLSLTAVADSEAKSFRSQRFGKPIYCLSAPLVKNFNIDALQIPLGTIVTYCDIPGETPSEENSIYGIIGLSLFSKKTVTLDYLSKRIYIEESR